MSIPAPPQDPVASSLVNVAHVGLISADTTPIALTVGRFRVPDSDGESTAIEIAIGAGSAAELMRFGKNVFGLEWDAQAFIPCRVVPEAGFIAFAASPAEPDRDESHPNPVARHMNGQLHAMQRELRLLNAQRTRVADRPPELEKLEARILAMTDVITTLAGLAVRESMQSRAHAPLARARDLPATGVQ